MPATGLHCLPVGIPDLDVAPDYWAEGLALVDDRLVQITYTKERAFTYDRDSFAPGETFSYDGEGWGCATTGSAWS